MTNAIFQGRPDAGSPFFKRIVLVAVAGLATGGFGQNLELSRRGENSGRQIVIPAAASESVRYAASELQAYVARLTGERLAIADDSGALPARAICVGETRHSPKAEGLGDEGYRLVAKPPHLFVVGSGVRGALYGVYGLLEDYAGVRWFTSWCEKVPRLDAFAVPADLDRTDRPAFAFREPMWADYSRADFAARRRMNGGSMKLTAKHGGHGLRFSGRFYGHAFYSLISPDKYFDTHPEYFALVSGTRRRAGAQLCLTNPDVRRIAKEEVLAQMRKEPKAEIFFIGQNDFYGFCECPACKAVDDEEDSHAGTLVRFINEIADAAAREFPDKTVGTFAYQYSVKPPKLAKLRKNVLIRLCSITCEFSRPLKGNPNPSTAAFVSALDGWARQTDRLYVWDYVTNFSHYPMVYPNVEPTLQENLKFFRDRGVRYILSQGGWQGWHAHYGELKSYLISKWMWNPDLPAEPLVREFTDAVYGKAAPIVRRDLEELRKLPADPVKRPLHCFQEPRATKNAFDDAWLAASDARWAEAEKAVADDPEALYNVRMGRFAVDYTRLARNTAAGRLWADPDRARYERDVVSAAEMARRAQSAMALAEAHKNRICFSEIDSVVRDMQNLIRRVAAPQAPSVSQKTFVFDDAFNCSVAFWGKVLPDPSASGGRALKLFNDHNQWAGNCSFGRFAFDTNLLYHVRVRLRADPGTGEEDPLAWAATSAVYDIPAKKEVARLSLRPSGLKEGYAWYDLKGDFHPHANQYLYVAPGTCNWKKFKKNPKIGALWVDQVEFSIVEKGAK